ncbi:hypothetical protein CMI45_01090 [Candidatus Pacearchaeota archaeon]|nr:hypothetical protein [Candidatus Pacearchaeota archaeon]|tara:strand:+ start:341 stop:745 length:405 start_codon:yes stop_codon:yes gene_type:complete
MKIKIKSIILILILINIALSGYSYYEDLTMSEICLLDQGCSIVRHSEYSTLFGAKVSLLGGIAFIVYLLIFLSSEKSPKLKQSFVTLTILGTIFAPYFIYVQLFILKAICLSCIAIDTIMIIISALVLYRNVKR